MSADLPDYYFRVRDNGAVVFRIDTENRQRRIDMEEIATVNINNGKVKPHGDEALSAEEDALIAAWVAERRVVLAARDVDDILRAVDHLNLTTQWAQSKASDDALELLLDEEARGWVTRVAFADLAGWAAPQDPAVHTARAVVYRARRSAETSLMAKGIFRGAARESEAVIKAALGE